MYLASNVHITFPEYQGKLRTSPRKQVKIKHINSFRYEKSWQILTDTCEFIIAKAYYLSENRSLKELIKPGDPFYIDAGYNGNYNRHFTGFISELLDDMPVVFKCEDNMYDLKRTRVHKVYKKVKLATMLREIVPAKFQIDAADIQLGDFVFKDYTVAQVLTELKDLYGIYSYFVNDTLVSGKIYADNPRSKTVVKFQFGRNIITNDLKYRNATDYQIKVTMTSHMHNGKKIKVTVGDPEGVEQKLVCSNVDNKADLEKLAKKELERLQYDGYRGTFTSFGTPYIEHGYTVSLVNTQNPDKTGNYYVDGVTGSFDEMGAIRLTNKLGPRAAA